MIENKIIKKFTILPSFQSFGIKWFNYYKYLSKKNLIKTIVFLRLQEFPIYGDKCGISQFIGNDTFSFFSFGLKRFIEFFNLRNSFFLPINFCKEFDEEPILLNDYVLNTPYKGKNKMNNHLNLIFKFSQFSLSTIATFAFFFETKRSNFFGIKFIYYQKFLFFFFIRSWSFFNYGGIFNFISGKFLKKERFNSKNKFLKLSLYRFNLLGFSCFFDSYKKYKFDLRSDFLLKFDLLKFIFIGLRILYNFNMYVFFLGLIKPVTPKETLIIGSDSLIFYFRFFCKFSVQTSFFLKSFFLIQKLNNLCNTGEFSRIIYVFNRQFLFNFNFLISYKYKLKVLQKHYKELKLKGNIKKLNSIKKKKKKIQYIWIYLLYQKYIKVTTHFNVNFYKNNRFIVLKDKSLIPKLIKLFNTYIFNIDFNNFYVIQESNREDQKLKNNKMIYYQPYLLSQVWLMKRSLVVCHLPVLKSNFISMLNEINKHSSFSNLSKVFVKSIGIFLDKSSIILTKKLFENYDKFIFLNNRRKLINLDITSGISKNDFNQIRLQEEYFRIVNILFNFPKVFLKSSIIKEVGYYRIMTNKQNFKLNFHGLLEFFNSNLNLKYKGFFLDSFFLNFLLDYHKQIKKNCLFDFQKVEKLNFISFFFFFFFSIFFAFQFII